MAGLPLYQRYGLDIEGARALLERAIQPPSPVAKPESSVDRVWVAHDQRAGLPLGVAWVSPRGGFSRTPYLKMIGVAAHHQGRGIGALLLGRCEAFAKGELMLLLTSDNAGARRFYQRHGYDEIGMIPDYVRPGCDECIYFKRGGKRVD